MIIHKSNSIRDNRYSTMIEMNLSHEGLETFDIEHVILGTLVSWEATATLKRCVKLLIPID